MIGSGVDEDHRWAIELPLILLIAEMLYDSETVLLEIEVALVQVKPACCYLTVTFEIIGLKMIRKSQRAIDALGHLGPVSELDVVIEGSYGM